MLTSLLSLRLLLDLLPSAALAAPPAPSLLPASCDTLNEFNRVAQMPIGALSPRHCAALDRGEVVTVVQNRSDGHYRVVGIGRTGLPKANMWVASQDPHFAGDEAIETPISLRPHNAIWYGMIDIPTPFADRHWVIENSDNMPLYASSNGRFCEHPWVLRLQDLPAVRDKVGAGKVAGLDLKMFDRAIATPVNEGALLFLDLGQNDSLYVYHMTTDIGGGIPDRLVAGYVRSTMTNHIKKIIGLAGSLIPAHYRGKHPLLLGCGEAKVPLFQ